MYKENDINDKITMDLIRVKLGRYTINGGLRFNYDAQDDETSNNENKKIIEQFDDYFNKHKIIIYSYEGLIKCVILNKHYDYYYNSIWLNICNKMYNDLDEYFSRYCTNKIKDIIEYYDISTTEIIFNLIKICNKE
jgi:hypothetical protein